VEIKEAKYYKTLNNEEVVCTLCPRVCKLKPGELGFCRVRKNMGGKLYTLAYGRPVAVHVDPIEKKPLYHFFPGSRILSIGTFGCNLGCLFCQNYDIARAEYRANFSRYLKPEEIIEASVNYNSIGIAYTYNEPTVFAEYVEDISSLAREKGLKNVMVTNGFISKKVLKEVYRYIDAANVDLKSMSSEFYRRYCLGELNPVLDAIIELKSMGIWVEITNLLIPGLNDGHKDIDKLVSWIINSIGDRVPLHFSAFYPCYQMLDRPRTSKSVLDMAREIALSKGMKYVYEGNVFTTEEGNTYCPSCGALLVERSYFDVVRLNVKDGRCLKCGNDVDIIC